MSSSIKEFQHLRKSLQDLKSATNNFAETKCVGRGGFGKVYVGEVLLSGVQTMVAIKRLDRSFGQGTTEFWKEIMLLSQYKHENLVSLLGYCDEDGENLLVYEYLSNKSLDLYLHSVDLSWDQRLNICLGAAMGLEYLHEPVEGSQQRVLHRDIKSANILLDHNWRSKIADFGLSKLGPANQDYTFLFSNAVGTMGYCDPLYATTGLLTKESDVYSFGVVLLEVLCGRPCVLQKYDDIRNILPALSRKCYEENKMDTIIPVGLHYNVCPESLKRFSAIANQCLKLDRAERPKMSKVVEELRIALDDQSVYQKTIQEAELKYMQSVATMQKIELKEITLATNNFKLCIGKNQFGVRMYEGELSFFGIPTRVLIQRFPEHSEPTLSEYLELVDDFSKLHHPNIISALGYCYEKWAKIIVHEYPEGVSLDQYISKSRRSSSNNISLTWLQRLQICADAARGLSYLHGKYRHVDDFKSACIFVDAKALNLPMKRDRNVYAFGMVLFEVLCGRLCTEEVDGVMLSAPLIKDLYENNKLEEIVDVDLKAEKISSYLLEKYSEIAYRCLLDDTFEQPSMANVVLVLEELLCIEGILKNTMQEDESKEIEVATMQKLEWKEIEVATDNFTSSYIGKTYKYAIPIYEGELSIFGKPTKVYIIRLHENFGGTRSDYLNVLDLYSKLRHPNIFSALGYCYKEEGQKAIVYERPDRGSLDQYIISMRSSNTTRLTWLQRLEICVGAARGLSYLHDRCEVVDGFKTATIGLYEKWVAKICNLGISTEGSTGADAAYNSPEYITDGYETEQSNVYSFGVVLFEVLCGRLCSEEVDGVMLSVKLIKDLYENKKLDEIVDPTLLNEDQKISSYSIDKYSEIVCRCLSDVRRERPPMAEVILLLEELLCIEFGLLNQKLRLGKQLHKELNDLSIKDSESRGRGERIQQLEKELENSHAQIDILWTGMLEMMERQTTQEARVQRSEALLEAISKASPGSTSRPFP